MAINPKIKQKAEDIRKKIFGSEVRESLASGIESISEDVEATIGRQDYVEEQFQNVIDETTDKDVISAPELIAARNGKSNLKTRLDDEHAQVTAQLQQTEQELNAQLAQIAINLVDYGAVGGGQVDCTPAIEDALSLASVNKSGVRIYAPFNAVGYKFSKQIVLNGNVELDLNGSPIIRAGELADSTLKSVIKVNGSGNKTLNIISSLQQNQFLIEYGTNASNNIEDGCRELTSGNNSLLVKNEQNNPSAGTNRSYTLEKFRKGKIKNSGIKKLIINNIPYNANQAKNLAIPNFPSECTIRRIIIKDNNNPDFFARIYSNNALDSNFYTRTRETTNIDVSVNLSYLKFDMDDVLNLWIYNYATSPTTISVEIWYDNEVYYNPERIWQYTNKEDMLRPHRDSNTNTVISERTIRAVEYRYKTVENGNNAIISSAVPYRDPLSSWASVEIPSHIGTQNKAYSQLKFYFDYSAKNAVVERPKRFIFEMRNPPKNIKANTVVGWISQNKDGDAGYLKQSMIYPNDKPYLLETTSGVSKFAFEIDPKSYETGSNITGPKSLDFFYFILTTDEEGKGFDFGEKYEFNAYFE